VRVTYNYLSNQPVYLCILYIPYAKGGFSRLFVAVSLHFPAIIIPERARARMMRIQIDCRESATTADYKNNYGVYARAHGAVTNCLSVRERGINIAIWKSIRVSHVFMIIPSIDI